MKGHFWRFGTLGITILILTICLGTDGAAAEKKRFLMAKKTGKILSEVNINDRADEKYRIRQWSRVDIITEHSDPSLVGAEETWYGLEHRPASLNPGVKVPAMGYTVTRSKDEDCFYIRFSSIRTITAASAVNPESETEAKIEIFGGTGKYLNAKGNGMCKSKSTASGQITTTCEGEWEF